MAAVLTSALLTTALLGAAIADDRARDDELKRVIDRNTGFAHMTRGMNMYTLIALRSCVTERDVPVLTRTGTKTAPNCTLHFGFATSLQINDLRPGIAPCRDGGDRGRKTEGTESVIPRSLRRQLLPGFLS